MKRTLISILCITSLLFLLSGCGSQEDASGQGSTEIRPKESVTAEAATQAASGNTKSDESVKATSAGDTKSDSKNQSLISEEEAKAIALKDAGVSENEVTKIRVKLDDDDGIQEYEVEFYVGNKEYDYDINASTGEILKKDMEIEDDFNDSGSSGKSAQAAVSEEEAKAIALKDAGLKETDVTGIRIKLEEDDGVLEYEVDFYAGNKEYDYDIDASTGKILSKDMEIEDDFQNNGGSGNSAQTAVTEAEAKKIALAKVPDATEKNIRIHLDYEDGKPVYEGSIVYGGMEYDFEIDASSGTILEWEQEKED